MYLINGPSMVLLSSASLTVPSGGNAFPPSSTSCCDPAASSLLGTQVPRPDALFLRNRKAVLQFLQ
jgi:hypothetical protein